DSQYLELPNFHQVNAQLYRGGQPKTGGLQKLKELGVKTVVNLRGEDDHVRAERTEARSLGLRFYSIALPEFSKPKDKEVQLRSDSQYLERPNFHQVNAQLYRGGQPKTGGLQKLKELGVKTVVNLRGEDDHVRAERTEARSLGLRFYSIALPEFSKPKDKEVQL